MVTLLYVLITGAAVGAAAQRLLPARKTASWAIMLAGLIGSSLAWLISIGLGRPGGSLGSAFAGAVIAVAIYWRTKPAALPIEVTDKAPTQTAPLASVPPHPTTQAESVRPAVSAPQPAFQNAPRNRTGEIFISYASPDRAFAQLLAQALQDQGWSVWWDRVIPPGKSFDAVIEEALDTAKCVVVLWSKSSVASNWVKIEAAEAARRHILIPALIAETTIPLEFRRIQAASLIDWTDTSRRHPGFQSLVASIQDLLGPHQ